MTVALSLDGSQRMQTNLPAHRRHRHVGPRTPNRSGERTQKSPDRLSLAIKPRHAQFHRIASASPLAGDTLIAENAGTFLLWHGDGFSMAMAPGRTRDVCCRARRNPVQPAEWLDTAQRLSSRFPVQELTESSFLGKCEPTSSIPETERTSDHA
jgi:hypothetical protein